MGGIRGAVEQAAPLVKGGQVQLRSLYLLDAGNQAGPADTQFFCSNASGSLTVTITMRALPPGRYALVLGDAAGAPLGRAMGLHSGLGRPAGNGWKTGGADRATRGFLTGTTAFGTGRAPASWPGRARRGAHGTATRRRGICCCRWIFFPRRIWKSWRRSRRRSKTRRRTHFHCRCRTATADWKIDAVRLDATLLQADLGVAYESTGVTDPAAQRTEAMAVLSALLKAQPGLRENFHGLVGLRGEGRQADAGDGAAHGADTVKTGNRE